MSSLSDAVGLGTRRGRLQKTHGRRSPAELLARVVKAGRNKTVGLKAKVYVWEGVDGPLDVGWTATEFVRAAIFPEGVAIP